MRRCTMDKSTSASTPAVALFPPGFRSQEMATDGATIHVRFGGTGPAVVLLHGFGDTGDMWAPVAAALASDHAVIVPDLRGMGLSSSSLAASVSTSTGFGTSSPPTPRRSAR